MDDSIVAYFILGHPVKPIVFVYGLPFAAKNENEFELNYK